MGFGLGLELWSVFRELLTLLLYICWVFGLGFDLNVDLFVLDSLGFCVMRFEFYGLLWCSLLLGWSWLFLGVGGWFMVFLRFCILCINKSND